MNDTSITPSQVFSLLEGTWTGEGRGGYPTVRSFAYSETLIFSRRDETTLAYEQRARKRYDGQTDWLVSHWENGFIRILEQGELELVNAQSGGCSELLIGTMERVGDVIRIHFTSKLITNDRRLLSSARTFELEEDRLRYEMEMQMTHVERSTSHLRGVLQRAR